MESVKREPVMKLEAERLWGGAGEYAISFEKAGWLEECRRTGGTFLLYTQPDWADFDRVTAERDALQLLLNNRDGLDDQLTSLEQRRYAEQQAREAAERRVEPLCAFANEMVSAAFEGGSLDGADIQDIAVKHGVLRIETREEECGEGCACREYGFPAECYRRTELIALNPTAEAESHDQ